MRRTNGDAVSAYSQVKMEDAPTLLKKFKVRVSRYLDTSTETHMAKSVVQYGRSTRSSWTKICMVILWQDFWERQVEKVLLEHGWEKVHNWECLFVYRKIGYSYLCMWMTLIGWKETNHWSDVESTKQRSWFGRTNIISWPCLLGLHSTRMSDLQGFCG